MFERFSKSARGMVIAAEREARELGATSIEAEHLLLALTEAPTVGLALREAGLDHDGLLEALDRETEAALQTVGVSAASFGPPPRVPTKGRVRWGTSAKAALERSAIMVVERGERKIEAGHLALAILKPAHGTVPRALAAADVDVRALRDRVLATL